MIERWMTGDPEYDVIVEYAEGRITREAMIDRLAENAVPAEHDPWPLGDGYRPGTRDTIRVAVGAGLLNEDDWNAVAERAKTVPDLMATVPGNLDGSPVKSSNKR